MSEPQDPKPRPCDVFGFDDVQGFDVEAIPCQDGIDAILTRGRTRTESVDSMLSEFTDTQIDLSDDHDCPAA
jgi:hypothetical protein